MDEQPADESERQDPAPGSLQAANQVGAYRQDHRTRLGKANRRKGGDPDPPAIARAMSGQ
jgi:hypothetical protein